MPNLYLPVAAIILSLITIIIYLSKDRVNLLENKLYLVMLFSTLIDSVLVSSLFFNVYTNYNEMLVIILNKIDYFCLIVWSSTLLKYIYVITYNNKSNFKHNYTIFTMLVLIVDIIIFIVISLSDIDIVLLNQLQQTAQGDAVNISITICLAYIVISLIIVLGNIKKISKKHLPVFIVIITAILIALLFSENPFIICISIGLAFDNLIMYFTIENPDLQIVSEYHKIKEISDKRNRDKAMFLHNVCQAIKKPTMENEYICKDILDNFDKDTLKEEIRVIESNSKYVLGRVNNVINPNNIRVENINRVDAMYNVKLLFDSLIALFKNKIKQDVELRYSIDSNIPDKLYGDSLNIKEVMLRILNYINSYTTKGVIDVSINSIIIDDICRLVIEIVDTGKGYIESDYDKLINDNPVLSKIIWQSLKK